MQNRKNTAENDDFNNFARNENKSHRDDWAENEGKNR